MYTYSITFITWGPVWLVSGSALARPGLQGSANWGVVTPVSLASSSFFKERHERSQTTNGEFRIRVLLQLTGVATPVLRSMEPSSLKPGQVRGDGGLRSLLMNPERRIVCFIVFCMLFLGFHLFMLLYFYPERIISKRGILESQNPGRSRRQGPPRKLDNVAV